VEEWLKHVPSLLNWRSAAIVGVHGLRGLQFWSR